MSPLTYSDCILIYLIKSWDSLVLIQTNPHTRLWRTHRRWRRLISHDHYHMIMTIFNASKVPSYQFIPTLFEFNQTGSFIIFVLEAQLTEHAASSPSDLSPAYSFFFCSSPGFSSARTVLSATQKNTPESELSNPGDVLHPTHVLYYTYLSRRRDGSGRIETCDSDGGWD